MPHLPSNVARYDSVDLLDLDQLPYVIIRRPNEATLQAWDKAEETERRWTMFDWATFVVSTPQQNRLLLQDFATAYLLSYEATLQFVLEECAIDDFNGWLRAQSGYDVVCRGIRTLRQLNAHIRAGTLEVKPNSSTYSRFASSAVGGTVAWRWPALKDTELQAVKSKNAKLDAAELQSWNELCDSTPVLDLMRLGLRSLAAIVANAQSLSRSR